MLQARLFLIEITLAEVRGVLFLKPVGERHIPLSAGSQRDTRKGYYRVNILPVNVIVQPHIVMIDKEHHRAHGHTVKTTTRAEDNLFYSAEENEVKAWLREHRYVKYANLANTSCTSAVDGLYQASDRAERGASPQSRDSKQTTLRRGCFLPVQHARGDTVLPQKGFACPNS